MNRETFELLLKRLLDFSKVPLGEIYFIYADTELSDYENLILHSSLTKPALLEFETELAKYEEELYQEAEAVRIAEEARLAELERIATLQARWDAIIHLRECLKALGLGQPNTKAFVRDNFENLEHLESIEAQDILEIEKAAVKQAEKDAKDLLKAELKAKVKDKSAKLEDVVAILDLMEW